MLSSRVAILHDNSTHGEDDYLLRPLGDHAFLDAVMDGVTRRRGGQASRLVADALAAAPLTSGDDVLAALEDVNHQLYEVGGGGFLLTTVAVALYLDGKLDAISVGDSPIFLIRSESCQQLFSGVRGMFMGASQQLVHVYRTALTIEPGDRLLLATDGVTDNITSRELLEVVRHVASPDEAAERLRTIMTTRQAGQRPPGRAGSF